MTVNDYVNLFSGDNRGKTRLVALASAVIQQAYDLMVLCTMDGLYGSGSLYQSYAINYAVGETLDDIAASLGLSRTDTTDGADVTDDKFRDFIKKKLILWTWDGRNETMKSVLDKIRSAASIVEGSSACIVGVFNASPHTLPASVKDLFPIPAGVKANVNL